MENTTTFQWTINRKKIFSILLWLTIICIVTRVVIFVGWKKDDLSFFVTELLIPLVEELSATFIVSSVIAGAVLFLKGTEEQIILLENKSQIQEALEKSRKDTQQWKFSGGTGTETRSHTIPFLAKLNLKKIIEIKIQILDPTNEELCSKYSAYRQKDNQSFTTREVQLKIYATVVSCLYWSRNARIDIQLYFKNTFSTLRYDISDKKAIITKEHPKVPAFLIVSPHDYFDAVTMEFDATLRLAKKKDLDNCSHNFKGIMDGNHNFTKEDLQREFACIDIHETFTDEEFRYIMETAKPAKA